MTKQQILEKNKDYIINKYRSGIGTSKLAKEFNCNPGTIWLFLKDNNIEIRNKRKNFYGKSFEIYKDKIVELYNQGFPCGTISKKINISIDTVIRILKKCGLDTHRYYCINENDMLKNHKDEIVALYNSGLSTNAIADKMGKNCGTIYTLLKNNNVKIRSKTKYSVNHNFFDVIDTENKAYILGLLYADGNVNLEHGTFRIFLQEDDRHLLEDVKKVIQYTGPIYTRNRKNEGNRKNLCILQISSDRCVKSLIEKGCIPNKSLVIEFPNENIIPDLLLSSFLRGMADGDGSISKPKNRKTGYVSLTSTGKFCIKLNEIMKKKLGIEGYIYYRYANKISASLMYTKKDYCKKFLDFIYSNLTSTSLKLNRKYQRYLDIFAD